MSAIADHRGELDRSRLRAGTYGATAVGLVCIWYFARDLPWKSDSSLHTLLEVVAAGTALVVATVALLRFYTRRNDRILLLAAGFLGTALLDTYHGVVTSTWFHQLPASPPPDLIPWSWNASRFFLAVLMLLSWWASERERKLGELRELSDKAVFALVGSLLLAAFGLFAFLPLPPAYYGHLPLGRPQELVAGFLYLLAFAGYLRMGSWRRDSFEHALVLSLLVGAITQVLFMTSSFSLFDVMFDAAHVLKIASYACVLAGLLRSTHELFLRAERTSTTLAAAQELLEQRVEERTIELHRSNADLDSFAYIASHDLRAPLRAIENLSQWIEEDLQDVLEGETRENMKLLRGRVRRLESLLDDLLIYSRIGRRKHMVERVDTCDLIEEIVSMLAPPEGFRIELAPDLPVLATTRTPLEQILRNLIDNSIKHADSNAGCIEVSAREREHVFEFAVTDDGPGIPEDLRDKAFGMFQTLKSRDTVEGSGIGLAIAKKNVEFLCGKIWIETPASGRGVRFVFTWPKQVRGGEEDREE